MKILLLICTMLMTTLKIKSKKALLVGGGLSDDNKEIQGAFINLSKQNGNTHIGIVTAASDTPEENGKFQVDLLKNTYKVQVVEWIPIHLNNTQAAYDPEILKNVEKMTGIFFGGGDQIRLIDCFQRKEAETPLLTLIIKKYNDGELAIAGTSAGTTIMQKTPMVTGGVSQYGLLYGPHPQVDPSKPDDLSYQEKGGFPIFDFGFLDTHYGVRGREGRTISLISELKMKEKLSFGIDEDTALQVIDNIGQVIGKSGVIIINLKEAQKLNDLNDIITINGIKVSQLTDDDMWNFIKEQPTFSAKKNNIKDNEKYDYPASTSYDIFSSPDNPSPYADEKFIYISTDLFNSRKEKMTQAFTYESRPSFKLIFEKKEDSVAYTTNDYRMISYHRLDMSISKLKENEGSTTEKKFLQ